MKSLRLVLAAAALPLLNILAYAWLSATEVVSRDQWRFLPMVQDWFAGQMHWADLWQTHSQHRIPAYKFLFLMDAQFLGLDMRAEVMLGALALATAVSFLLRRFSEGLQGSMSQRDLMLGLLSLAALGLSLDQWNSLVYGLGALNGLGRVADFLAFWLLLDKCLRQGARPVAIAGLSLFLIFILACWAGGHGPAFLVASFAAIGIARWRDGAGQGAKLVWTLAAVALIVQIIYWSAGSMSPVRGASGALLQHALHAPGQVLEYGLMAFSSSALPIAGMENHGWPHLLSLLIGLVIAAAYAFAWWAYIGGRSWRTSFLPGFLMGYSLLVIASIFLARFGNEGLASASAPRYVLDTQVGLMGCFWSLFLWRASRPAGDRTALTRATALPLLCSVVLLVELGVSGMLWRHDGEQRRMSAEAVGQVRAGDYQAQDWICPDLKLCVAGAEFMRQRHLNVFKGEPHAANDPPGTAGLDKTPGMGQ